MDGLDEEGGGLACWNSVICGGLGRIKFSSLYEFGVEWSIKSSLLGVGRSVESFLAK